MADKNIPLPSQGLITFKEEGHEGGKYHSRKPHVPSESSGCTIGRGYDMKTKKKDQIYKDLKEADPKLNEDQLKKLAGCAGLSGKKAKEYLTQNDLWNVEISGEAQLSLFRKVYNFEKSEAARLCTKKDVTKTYGDCRWGEMNIYLKEFITDLKYQGLYTPKTRRFLQKPIVERDYKALKRLVMEKLPNEYRKRNTKRSFLLDKAEQADKQKKKVIEEKNRFKSINQNPSGSQCPVPKEQSIEYFFPVNSPLA